jgi:hypothetical protein
MEKFEYKSPCGNCPYRRDSPLRHWHIEEFQKVWDAEESDLGAMFMCHKKNGSVCIGFLMNQDAQNFPSIMLRLSLAREKVSREYLDSLSSPAELFETAQEMCEANYPEEFYR